MTNLLTVGFAAILTTATLAAAAQDAPPEVVQLVRETYWGPLRPAESVAPRLQALVDKAVALGFPDARGAEIYVGEITVRQHGPGGESESRYGGAHAHLRDGRWMVQLAYPLTVVPGSITVDTTAARLVTDKAVDIMHGFEKYPDHSHPENAEPVWMGPPVLSDGKVRLGGHGAACAVLIDAGIHQHQDIPEILDCLPVTDDVIIGPNRLLLCAQRQATSAIIAAHDQDTRIALAGAEDPAPQVVMAYALAAWFAMNLKDLPAPFSALPEAAALAGATALLPAGDLGARDEVLRTTVEPTAADAADVLALRLASWRKDDSEVQYLDVAKLSQLADRAASHPEHLEVPDWAKRQLPAFVASRFGADDLPALVRAAGDLRPSGWDQGGHRRTIGDQALRAIASVLGFDPRVLVQRPLDAPWNDAERLAVATGLARWWPAHAQDGLARIRLDAAPQVDWRQVGYLLKAAPPEETVPLLRLVVQRWHDGPPPGFDDVELLDLAASDPESDQVVNAWPVTGPSGPLLAFYRVLRGLPVALEGGLDSALLATPPADHAPSAEAALFAIAHRLDTGILAHLHTVLAVDPLGPAGETLVRCCLEERDFDSSTAFRLWRRANFDARLAVADEIVQLAMLSQLLDDVRPLPDGLRSWAESLRYYEPSGYRMGERPHRTLPADFRIADCAAGRAPSFDTRTLSNYHNDYSASRKLPQDLYDFAPNQAIAERDAHLARVREYVRGVLADMVAEFGVPPPPPPRSANGF